MIFILKRDTEDWESNICCNFVDSHNLTTFDIEFKTTIKHLNYNNMKYFHNKVLFVLAGMLVLGFNAGASAFNSMIPLAGEPEGEMGSPQNFVSVLPSSYDWFDALSVVWGEDPTQPYEISSEYAQYDNYSGNRIFNAEGRALFKMTENGVKDLDILQVAIVEFQASDDAPNLPSAQLVITLAGFQTNVGSQYNLTFPEGIINIKTSDDETVMNSAVDFTFTLQSSQKFELPDPVVSPAPDEVNSLESVKVYWEGTLGGFDLLNKNNGDIKVSYNGEAYEDFEVKFEWSSRLAVTDGAEGDNLVITFPDNLQDGTYIVDIPAGYLWVSDIEEGTLESQAITLVYNVEKDSAGVAEFEATTGKNNIYTIHGSKIRDAEIKHLPAGIYVINGKKVVIGISR